MKDGDEWLAALMRKNSSLGKDAHVAATGIYVTGLEAHRASPASHHSHPAHTPGYADATWNPAAKCAVRPALSFYPMCPHTGTAALLHYVIHPVAQPSG